MTDGQHLWTTADRRAQLSEIRKLARGIKKRYCTSAYDEIIAVTDRFLKVGFTETELKDFSRRTGSPPGWLHPRSDQYAELERDDPKLVRALARLKELIEDLRTIGRL